MDKKTIGMVELKDRFTRLNQELGNTNANISKLQQALGQEQAKSQQILGAMQSVADLMVTLVGQEEAQKIVSEIQNLKKDEVKLNGENKQ